MTNPKHNLTDAEPFVAFALFLALLAAAIVVVPYATAIFLIVEW
jgi:hypothetical protein